MPVIRKIYKQGHSYVVTIPEWMLESIGALEDENHRWRLMLEVVGGKKIQASRFAYEKDIGPERAG